MLLQPLPLRDLLVNPSELLDFEIGDYFYKDLPQLRLRISDNPDASDFASWVFVPEGAHDDEAIHLANYDEFPFRRLSVIAGNLKLASAMQLSYQPLWLKMDSAQFLTRCNAVEETPEIEKKPQELYVLTPTEQASQLHEVASLLLDQSKILLKDGQGLAHQNNIHADIKLAVNLLEYSNGFLELKKTLAPRIDVAWPKLGSSQAKLIKHVRTTSDRREDDGGGTESSSV